MIRVTVWNEFRHEKINPVVSAIYPDGIHETIKRFLDEDGRFEVRTAWLDMPDCGLSQSVLDETDVLIWWGHKAHHEVPDEVAARVIASVQAGMGFIALHSAHLSKPFRGLMGSTCTLKWRKSGEKERLWNVCPTHPIMQGIGDYFELEHVEMYGERFDIPTPDQILTMSWYPGGEVFRSACTWSRGNGKIFYFKPGHETFPIYENKNVQTIICNAVNWCAPVIRQVLTCPNVQPLEPIVQIEC